ncbi:cell division protein PerM [Microbacterium sp. zg.Y909]|uniref:cell division protein PerM n=1 Tax=Microbacterium sp. zg.Y909 TaxID=2969413 RepID=UPI00214A9258|nr:DUF6350 family protein [Microbacterium sp. zg.Y909]MCR2825715.1 DUF6350 family protein [Microbacterium sp. zg.Y909]
MNRLLVALLAAFDAVLAVAVGLVAALAPLTLLWIFGFGADAPWVGLWPAAGRIWQLGHLVPLAVSLPEEFTVPLGIDAAAASFTVSLAPLALTVFTAVFAFRSGARAAAAGAWVVGVLTGAVVVVAAAAAVLATTANDIAAVEPWQAVALPALVYTVPALAGAVSAAWRDGDDGVVDSVRVVLDRRGGAWSEVPGLIARGTAIVLMALIGVGALLIAAAVLLRGSQIIALFQSAQVDALGASVFTVGHLAYLPTFVVWAVSFIAGPGFAVGLDTVVSPVGTQVGLLPGIPVLGALPESPSPWLLLLALLPVAAGALAGWTARSQLVRDRAGVPGPEPMGARVVVTLGIALLSGAGAALLAAVASGSIGPGTLASVGPDPGPLALTVGLEAAIGAAVLLLSPRGRDEPDAALESVQRAPEPAPTTEPIPVVFDATPDPRRDDGIAGPEATAERGSRPPVD